MKTLNQLHAELTKERNQAYDRLQGELTTDQWRQVLIWSQANTKLRKIEALTAELDKIGATE